jgi:hypothetical protein
MARLAVNYYSSTGHFTLNAYTAPAGATGLKR